jgi:uncharacterized protein (TIGR00251 family)
LAEGFVRELKDGGVSLKLRVSPDARETSIVGRYGEAALKIRVAAPPAGGKANAEISRFLAEVLGVPGSRVSVTGGLASRDKVVLVRDVAAELVRDLRAG